MKAGCQRRARHSDMKRKFGDCPAMARVAVQSLQGFGHVTVGKSRKPPAAAAKFSHVLTQNLDKQQFRESAYDAVAALTP